MTGPRPGEPAAARPRPEESPGRNPVGDVSAAWPLRPGLRRVLAPNPSPMTGPGTNTYILGEGRVAVVDPGPDSAAHLAAIRSALARGETVSHIILTHSHLDHAALARRLADETGAPVLAFRPPEDAPAPYLTPPDARLDAPRDAGFRPDAALADGDGVHGEGWTLRVLHTPGHLGDHVCLLWDGDALSGDHVMAWSTSLVAPPEGDMAAYMASLDRLAAAAPRRLWPGHGPPVADAGERIADLARHRRLREAQILAALAEGPATAEAIAARLYTGTPPALLPAAALSVLAHLIDLEARSRVTSAAAPAPATPYRLT